jgi:polyisoprenoid-binding protein YceI
MKYYSIIFWLIPVALAGATGAAETCWKPVPDPAAMVFISTQAGAPLKGTFHNFDAEICFDPDHTDTPVHIEVRIATASVDTYLPELDEALRGPDFFDSAKWPYATYISDKIQDLGNDQYLVSGNFTLRNVTRTIEVPFVLIPSTTSRLPRLEGSTTIKRLDYNVGQGEWLDTRWVGNDVVLKFSVKLNPADNKNQQLLYN